MKNFIERIKSYSKRKDTADMAIRAWKSVNEEVYTNFCKRIDAVAKGGITVLMDMYQMMRDCTPPGFQILPTGRMYQTSQTDNGLANIPRPSPNVSQTNDCG